MGRESRREGRSSRRREGDGEGGNSGGNRPAKVATAAASATAKAAAPASAQGKSGQANGQQTKITDAAGRVHTITKRVTQADRQAAAARLKALRTQGGVTASGGISTFAAIPPPVQGATGEYLIGPNGQLIPDYSGLVANWAYSPPLTKFADALGNPNTLPDLKALVAKPDVLTYPGSDYYEIRLIQTTWQFHPDLPPTTVRIYQQTNQGTDTSGCTPSGDPPVVGTTHL